MYLINDDNNIISFIDIINDNGIIDTRTNTEFNVAVLNMLKSVNAKNKHYNKILCINKDDLDRTLELSQIQTNYITDDSIMLLLENNARLIQTHLVQYLHKNYHTKFYSMMKKYTDICNIGNTKMKLTKALAMLQCTTFEEGYPCEFDIKTGKDICTKCSTNKKIIFMTQCKCLGLCATCMTRQIYTQMQNLNLNQYSCPLCSSNNDDFIIVPR